MQEEEDEVQNYCKNEVKTDEFIKEDSKEDIDYCKKEEKIDETVDGKKHEVKLTVKMKKKWIFGEKMFYISQIKLAEDKHTFLLDPPFFMEILSILASLGWVEGGLLESKLVSQLGIISIILTLVFAKLGLLPIILRFQTSLLFSYLANKTKVSKLAFRSLYFLV
uniref:Transmembrane protein n=1 Tax=Strongyloides venezuelensis TaxID=75913 RepID=A0A0K0FTD7_STRVS